MELIKHIEEGYFYAGCNQVPPKKHPNNVFKKIHSKQLNKIPSKDFAEKNATMLTPPQIVLALLIPLAQIRAHTFAKIYTTEILISKS